MTMQTARPLLLFVNTSGESRVSVTGAEPPLHPAMPGADR